jgi:hypothetical protein
MMMGYYKSGADEKLKTLCSHNTIIISSLAAHTQGVIAAHTHARKRFNLDCALRRAKNSFSCVFAMGISVLSARDRDKREAASRRIVCDREHHKILLFGVKIVPRRAGSALALCGFIDLNWWENCEICGQEVSHANLPII